MSVELIQKKLLSYGCKTIVDQENALKEIAQEIALMSLSRSGFFDVAAFQGGTCLRILYGLNRFSEDLDFILEKHDPSFDWEKYLDKMATDFNTYGYFLEVKNRKNVEKSVKMAFLKAESKGGVLVITDLRTNRPKLNIKLEIDSNPPAGSVFELKYLDFPSIYGVKVQTLPTLFASKCHALLCREYVKGRDWYDFIWYVSRETQINFELLSNALEQSGPWKGHKMPVNAKWVIDNLIAKINEVDWVSTKKDVERFLDQNEAVTLNFWSRDFFISRVEKLSQYLR